MYTSLTLFGSQEPQLIRGAGVVGPALPIVTVLKNDTEAIELLHQDLNDCKNQSVDVEM
jgi:hypothetical protein